MRPDPRVQIRYGAAAAIAVLAVVLFAAFVPDPLFRHRTFVTSIDDVSAVTAGVPVYFNGGAVGEVKGVRLDPARNLYDVALGLPRDWTPPPCSVVHVAASNPLTAPRIEVVAPSGQATTCAAFRVAQGCVRLAPPPSAAHGLDGCVRTGDLTQLAAAAIGQATRTLGEVQGLVGKLDGLVGGFGKPGTKGPVDFALLARNVTETTTSVNALAAKANATLDARRQADLGAAIGNLRTISGKAAALDLHQLDATVARTNALLEKVNGMIEENRASLQALAQGGAGLTGDSRELLTSLQASTVAAGANLERASANLDALSDRLKGDPGYVLHGTRYADPPPPGGAGGRP